MQIRVKGIKKLPLKGGSGGTVSYEILVAEAKLVLVECETNTSLTKALHYNRLRIVHSDYKCHSKDEIFLKPILISETEKIEKSDDVYGLVGKRTIHCYDQASADLWNENKDRFFKVLVLQEHFSSEHLQMIVDGKLKDGDKVLVECELQGPGFDDTIKLNSSNHITMYKIEEKSYTREELEPLFYKAMLDALNHPEQTKGRGLISFHKEWFKQNVK